MVDQNSDFPPFAFVGAIIGGGASRRMGADKALLLHEGEPMWQRQRATLHAAGAERTILIGPARADFPPEFPCVPDDEPNRGPLAGLATALRVAAGRPVLALAIDMPLMDPAGLRSLFPVATTCCGVVPFVREGGREFFEPLAALYPAAVAPLAAARLARQDWSMQAFVRECVESGLVRGLEIAPARRRQYRNVNTPQDLAQIQPAAPVAIT